MLGINGHLAKTITDEVNTQMAILSDPTAISSLEDYKYYVGFIKGLETALEILNQHLIEVDSK